MQQIKLTLIIIILLLTLAHSRTQARPPAYMHALYNTNLSACPSIHPSIRPSICFYLKNLKCNSFWNYVLLHSYFFNMHVQIQISINTIYSQTLKTSAAHKGRNYFLSMYRVLFVRRLSDIRIHDALDGSLWIVFLDAMISKSILQMENWHWISGRGGGRR